MHGRRDGLSRMVAQTNLVSVFPVFSCGLGGHARATLLDPDHAMHIDTNASNELSSPAALVSLLAVVVLTFTERSILTP